MSFQKVFHCHCYDTFLQKELLCYVIFFFFSWPCASTYPWKKRVQTDAWGYWKWVVFRVHFQWLYIGENDNIKEFVLKPAEQSDHKVLLSSYFYQVNQYASWISELQSLTVLLNSVSGVSFLNIVTWHAQIDTETAEADPHVQFQKWQNFLDTQEC